MREIKIPVGISDFKEIREGSYYYIPESSGFPFTRNVLTGCLQCGKGEYFCRIE